MTAPKNSVVVARAYRNSPDDCARALALLLKKPVTEGGPATSHPDDGPKSKEDFAHDTSIPGSS